MLSLSLRVQSLALHVRLCLMLREVTLAFPSWFGFNFFGVQLFWLGRPSTLVPSDWTCYKGMNGCVWKHGTIDLQISDSRAMDLHLHCESDP